MQRIGRMGSGERRETLEGGKLQEGISAFVDPDGMPAG
jgi:hypothetical protein